MKRINKKIIFIGGLTNGYKTLEFLVKTKYIKISLAITSSISNVPRFKNLKQNFKELKVIETKNLRNYYKKIKKIKPDLIIVSGWSSLIDKQILEIPKKGVVGFHPSNLPKDRGRSTLAWQIEEGYKNTALTMFYYNTKPDSGNIIAKKKIVIKKTDYIENILDKVDIATEQLLKKYFKKLFFKNLKSYPQNEKKATYRTLRTKKNQIINWDEDKTKILNKIRALSKPYPGAIAVIKGKVYKIWRAKINYSKKPKKNTFIKKCKNGYLEIEDYEPC